MSQTILITGASDGIGRLTAERLAAQGHRVLLHGRNPQKLAAVAAGIAAPTEQYVADLSDPSQVEALAEQVRARHDRLDVLINNAGVLKAPRTRTADGLDLRFMVNTVAPWILTQRLLPVIPATGRVVNLSSAAQAPIDVRAMAGQGRLDDMPAYAQSKLAITIWSKALADTLPDGPVVVAVNPGSLLASKMVKEGFGVAGKDLGIGADILCQAALDPRFATASGRYFDNDARRFAAPHPAAANPDHVAAVMQTLEQIAASLA